MTVAFLHLLTAELNRGQCRPFSCGWCGGIHEAKPETLPADQVRYLVTPGHVPCGLAGEYATAWEAAVCVACAVDAGGHLHQLRRDGAF